MTLKQTQQILWEFQQKKMSLQSDNAVRWLADKMSTIQGEMRQPQFIDNNSPLRRNTLIKPGQMALFGYNPATKSDLMFWDEFPLVIVLHVKRGSFLGLNLHYLPYLDRARFLNNLKFFVTDPRWIEKQNNSAEFFLTYKMAKSSNKLRRDMKPCIKKYYFKRMLTRMCVIQPMDWMAVPFFPLDKFKGMGRKAVWSIIKSGA